VRTHEEAQESKPAGVAPKSRLFWEIKADQVLNRIFEPETVSPETSGSGTTTEFTDVEIIHFSPARNPGLPTGHADLKTNSEIGAKPWVVISLIGLTTIALTAVIQAKTQQNAFEKANNMQLLTQLRQNDSTDNTKNLEQSSKNIAESSIIPPTPPSEEWIQELAKLPGSDGRNIDLLKVPLPGAVKPLRAPGVNNTISRPTESSVNSLPLLLGVIQGVGKSGAEIIKWEGDSTSVNSGETIGTSGWRLRETNSESAIIERGGQQKRISINSGN
jgi:hypothetical protein